MLIKRFKIPVYYGTLIVCVSDNLQSAVDKLKIEFNAHGFGALARQRTLKNGYREYSVLLLPNVGKAKIAHEAKHIVNMVFHWVGMELDTQNDEAECYFLEWVFGKIEDVVNIYNEKNADNN